MIAYAIKKVKGLKNQEIYLRFENNRFPKQTDLTHCSLFAFLDVAAYYIGKYELNKKKHIIVKVKIEEITE